MKLLVDIGNTSIKWATWDSTRPDGDAAGPLGDMGSAKHFGALPIDLLAAWDSLDNINGIVAARVGPAAVLNAVAKVADASWQCGVTEVQTAAEAQGIRIAYAEPARLGVDRFLALIGAHTNAALPNGPKLIIDAGTAVTYDLLGADGRHLGGLILPGVQLMRDSLLTGTQIPRYEPVDANQAWTADTGEAIAAASIQAPAALAERLRQRLQTETGDPPTTVITGGDAERLIPALDQPAIHDPALVLRGLGRYG
ncbi:MAG: type III pantothenate kinase [Thiohalocapsa sp.]|nr:type III pantothenate kinase [Thiohalocapsa sp.]MCF7991707.1 type III pantothenate kinase [Thiohalocapsa sp.]